MYGNRTLALLALAALAGFYSPINAAAAEVAAKVATDSATGVVSLTRKGAWHLAESSNFQVCSLRGAKEAQDVAVGCERLRNEVATLCGLQPGHWSPRCQIVLHVDAKSYVATVGHAGAATAASALTQRSGARINRRKIDVRGDVSDYLTSALPHELCHVLLADRFADVPLWCDEGLALLLDPLDKQQLHERDLRSGDQRGELMPINELFGLQRYPAAERWGLFYGQSASIVRCLLQRGTPQQLLAFAKAQRSLGTNKALREVYGLSGVAELDRHWRSSLASPSDALLTLVTFAASPTPFSAVAEAP